MTASKVFGKITAIILSVALLQVPYGLGLQNSSDSEQQRLETCRRLLESIGNSKQATSLASGLKATSQTKHLVDLRNTDFNSFKSVVSQAKVDDVLIVNEGRLADAQFTSALASSPALFTVAATGGTGDINGILNSRGGQPEILVAIPTDAAGVEKVFGVPASVSAPTVKYMDATSEQFRALRHSHLLNYSTNRRTLAENLISKAARETSDPLIVVAHNERGILKFPDGSSVRVDAIYKALGKRAGVVLSCDTIKSEKTPANVLLTNRLLDFRDVARGLASAEYQIAKNPDLSLGALLFAFSQGIPIGESSSAKTVKVVAMIVGGLIVVGLLYYWICEDSDSPPAFCPKASTSDAAMKKEGKS